MELRNGIAEIPATAIPNLVVSIQKKTDWKTHGNIYLVGDLPMNNGDLQINGDLYG